MPETVTGHAAAEAVKIETTPPTPRRRVSPLAVFMTGGFLLGLMSGLLVVVISKGWPARSNSTAALWGSSNPDSLPATDPLVGQPAPDFSLKTLDGGRASLSDFAGRPVLVNFWASWCVPCRLETPELVQAYQTHEDEGLVILGVNQTITDPLPDVKAFVAEFKIPYPVLLDEIGAATDLYTLRGLPTSVFVNRQGLITRIYLGGMSRELIDQYLGEILK